MGREAERMGQRERVRQAIEAPVGEANKLLEDLQNADSETRISILISGWGRGLAAGLEELAIAIDELQQQNADTTSAPTAATPPPSAAVQQAASEDRSAQVELEGASEAQLADEAKRSRQETAELRKETEEARREFEP